MDSSDGFGRLQSTWKMFPRQEHSHQSLKTGADNDLKPRLIQYCSQDIYDKNPSGMWTMWHMLIEVYYCFSNGNCPQITMRLIH